MVQRGGREGLEVLKAQWVQTDFKEWSGKDGN